MLRLPAEWLSIDQVGVRTDDLALCVLTVWVSGGELGTNEVRSNHSQETKSSIFQSMISG